MLPKGTVLVPFAIYHHSAVCLGDRQGAHGKAVAIAAKARGVNSYGVLLETLQAICEREREVNVRQGQQAATIAIKWDTSMLSPKNAFITVSKFREQPVAPSAAELLQAAADQAS